MSEILWQPGPDRVEKAQITKFSRWLSEQVSQPFTDYTSLHDWSIKNLEAFWASFLRFTELKHSTPPTTVLDRKEMPGTRWFSDMRLNFAENILELGFTGTAIEYYPEGNPDAEGRRSYSYAELRNQVARCTRAMREYGICKGDRVAGYIANVPEAVIACLACASIGATWASASPDFGLDALCDRFAQVKPRLVFASTRYQYGGKLFNTDRVLAGLKERIPQIETLITIPAPSGTSAPDIGLPWEQFLGSPETAEIQYEQVEFSHPLYILFSSGTTGAPKCIVHGTGGPLLQHRKEQQLHCDLREGDSLLFFTTCGWMMWNWQLSALSIGVKIGLYDGNPGFPDLSAIWHLVEESGISHFGTSGRFIESCMKTSQETFRRLGRFPELRSVMYTGSPLGASGFRWVYDRIKSDLHLAGISGGTEIVSCFILGNPVLPVRAGEIQCKGLAVDVAAYDERGQSIEGCPGELVCRQPLPCMPISFLNDAKGEKYREAYFDVYPGIWHHGDYVEFTESGGATVYGRSDATLNPGGVRIGSAEIYSALDSVSGITGAVAVGWLPPNESDELIVLLVVLSSGMLSPPKIEELRKTIREKTSPRHVPRHVFQISELPVTRSGKTVELSVKAILAGRPIANRDAVSNPAVLAECEEIRQKLLDLHEM